MEREEWDMVYDELLFASLDAVSTTVGLGSDMTRGMFVCWYILINLSDVGGYLHLLPRVLGPLREYWDKNAFPAPFTYFH
jgi:hypothetical protein